MTRDTYAFDSPLWPLIVAVAGYVLLVWARRLGRQDA